MFLEYAGAGDDYDLNYFNGDRDGLRRYCVSCFCDRIRVNVKWRSSLDLHGGVDFAISACVYVYYVNQCICGERELWQVSSCSIFFCLFAGRLDNAL